MINRALAHFQLIYDPEPVAAHILTLGADRAIVRVMYYRDRRPPDRAWFEISSDLTLRELSFDDVHALESPWR
ncbi:MAG: hypothetical protein HC920_17385 [Oscillatoriales cyanobacterium SM2_3_0]|nr:hypothetical protein [Oscillatoriales cyanobacterium SM2_3_0]